MSHASLAECLEDLARAGHLVRIDTEVDADLEAAEIHRRVFRAGGPALHFTRVKGCRFSMVSNLFGTLERARYMFRDTLESVRRLIELKVDPGALWKREWIDAGRIHTVPHLRRIVVAIDPAVSSSEGSDETGIVVAGIALDAHIKLLNWGSLQDIQAFADGHGLGQRDVNQNQVGDAALGQP